MPFYNNNGYVLTPKFLGFATGFMAMFFVLITHTSVRGQEAQKGVIIDSVTISDTANESFALYLPSSFEENALNPIVFVFEPAARGRVGITPFIQAAETHGYIIVCSNNSKNGPMEKNFQIANRLFNHVFSNFNIKESAMIIAGFSGGARLASSIAVLTNQFSGVIAVGAGFSSVPSYAPFTQNFKYAAICGNEDMNYREMRNNKAFLDRLKLKNTLFTYNAGHQWPPQNEINRVFRWLLNQKNSATNLKLDVEETLDFEASGELIFAMENYKRMRYTYGAVDSIVVREERLEKSKDYKKEVKALAIVLEKERRISEKLFEQFKKDLKTPKSVNLDWWDKEFRKIIALKTVGIQSEKMTKRIINALSAAFYESRSKYQDNSLQQMLSTKLREIIYPK